MFELVKVTDILVFQKQMTQEEMTSVLQEKYVGKIMKNVGLVIGVWNFIVIQSFESIEEFIYEISKIFYQRAWASYFWSFYRRSFRRKDCEQLRGRLASVVGICECVNSQRVINESCYLVRLQFSDENEKLWTWRFQDSDLFYDNNELIRFKVQQFNYQDKNQNTVLEIIVSFQIRALAMRMVWDQSDDECRKKKCSQSFLTLQNVVKWRQKRKIYSHLVTTKQALTFQVGVV